MRSAKFREGRSFNPDEFAIALEQVVVGTAPADYRDPQAFFARTCFTRALREHAGMVLRRLAGKTANTSPVMTLVTQFGGGKTHTLTALYHLVTAGESVGVLPEVTDLLHDAGLSAAPAARVAVFVGNAWDPREGREAPWVDIFVVIADGSEPDGLKGIDLGAGHSSGSESLCGRVISALKSSALLNESVGAGYLERNWPPAFKKDGVWPLLSLRQSFLDGSLTRLVDPDAVLRRRIVEFVAKGDFGLGSGRGADGRFERLWFRETVGSEDVMFESDVYLLAPGLAEGLKAPVVPPPAKPAGQEGDPTVPTGGSTGPGPGSNVRTDPEPPVRPEPPATRSLRIHGDIPPEVWNRVGTRLLPKLRSGRDLKVGVTFKLMTDGPASDALLAALRQILDDLQLADRIAIDVE